MPTDRPTPALVIIRHPDEPNMTIMYGLDDMPVLDVDLGYADLADPAEFTDWAIRLLVPDVGRLPASHPARTRVIALIGNAWREHRPIESPFADPMAAALERVRADQALSYPDAKDWDYVDLAARAYDVVYDHRSGWGDREPAELDLAYAMASVYTPATPNTTTV